MTKPTTGEVKVFKELVVLLLENFVRGYERMDEHGGRFARRFYMTPDFSVTVEAKFGEERHSKEGPLEDCRFCLEAGWLKEEK